MNQSKRVFITGYSAVTASGSTAEETWDAILTGKDGLDEIKQWDLSSWEYKKGGEIKNFQPAKMLPDRKLAKVISRQDVIGIHAAVQAVEHSELLSFREGLDERAFIAFNEETAVYAGSPGNKYYQQYDFLPLLAKTEGDMHSFAKHLFEEVHPMWLLRILPNNVLAYTGITYGFKGPNHNITNHAVGGMQALIEAFHAIRTGQAARAVVVAYDIGTEPQALFYYSRLGVISARHLKPFDREHDGTILAEGAAAIVLESEESANARGANCYGEMLGGLTTTEGAGLFSLQESGDPLAFLLSNILENQAINPTDIGLLVAHGNGNKKSDISEACAINSAFSEYPVPISAFKWSMGHTLCASGLIDTVLATRALYDKCIPGVANFENPVRAAQGLNISKSHRSLNEQKPYVLVINRGFASVNACVVIKACG